MASTSATSGSRLVGLDLGELDQGRRLDFEHLADLVGEVGEPALGAFEALLGARGLVARVAQGFQRGAGGPVGLGERVLGLGQTIGGGAARGFGGFDLADQIAALFGEELRRIGKLGALLRRLLRARLEGRDLGGGVVAALAPAVAFGADGLEPAVGKLGLARERLRLGAHLGERAALVRRSRREQRRAWLRDRRRAAARRARLPPRAGRREPRRGWRRGGSWLRSAPKSARCCVRSRARPRRVPRAHRRRRAARRASACGRRSRPRPPRSAAASAASTARRLASTSLRASASSLSMSASRSALGEPARGAGRRMGVDGKAVPAPQVAVARDEALAGLEQRREARAVGAIDHADLGEPARQFRRRLDVLRERGRALRQRRIGRIDRGAGPAHRRRGVDRRVEIVAERRAERASRSPSGRRACRSPAATGSWSRPRAACAASWLRCRAAARALGVRQRRARASRSPGARRGRLRRRSAAVSASATAACAVSTAVRAPRDRAGPAGSAARPASILAISASSRLGALGLLATRAWSSWLRLAVRSASAPVSSPKVFSAARDDGVGLGDALHRRRCGARRWPRLRCEAFPPRRQAAPAPPRRRRRAGARARRPRRTATSRRSSSADALLGAGFLARRACRGRSRSRCSAAAARPRPRAAAAGRRRPRSGAWRPRVCSMVRVGDDADGLDPWRARCRSTSALAASQRR